MVSKELKNAVLDHYTLIIDAEDGSEPRTMKLTYGYGALARIEEATGLDLKKIDDWQKISSGKHFPAIVWGGLKKFHPEVSLDEVIDFLNPAAQRLLSDEIFFLMFPGMKEVIEKQKATGATADPNQQAGTTTT